MDIIHIGHSSFRIKGKKASLVTDPYDPDFVGMKLPKIEADIVTISHSHQDHSFIEGVAGSPLVINGPGEYEIKGVKINGMTAYHDHVKGEEKGKNTIYLFDIDKIKIAHLGDLAHRLNDETVEIFNSCDILMLPVGGGFSLNAEQAAAVVTQLEPYIIIPMHYQDKRLNAQTFGHLLAVDDFIKETGMDDVLRQPKLSVSRDKLPEEPTIIILE